MSDNISLVIRRSAELEKILKNKFRAEGSGLGQRVRYVENKLAPELTKKLWWIVGIRNDAAHEPESFQLHDPEKFIRTCDEVKAMLDTIKDTAGNHSELNSSQINKKNPTNKTYHQSISLLIYAGIIMALAVQFFRANGWTIPFFNSYEYAFATSFFLTACGVAHTAYIWQNAYLSLGIILTTIGGFAWKFKWIIPVFKTYEIPLYFGIFIILYALVPQFIGAILVIAGSLLLSVELWLMFTKGLVAIHSGNLLVSVIFLGLSVLMFRRQQKLEKTGLFRSSKTNDS